MEEHPGSEHVPPVAVGVVPHYGVADIVTVHPELKYSRCRECIRIGVGVGLHR